jgi:effector-binding domain-containing protein
MQGKTIKSVLRRKIDAWIASIEDESLRSLVKENVIVTGGSIVSMLQSQPVNDYDVYFRTGEAAFRVAQYYIRKFGNAARHVSLIDEEGEECSRFPNERFRIKVKSAGVVSVDGFNTDEEATEEEAKELSETAAEKGKAENEFKPVFMSSSAITLSDKIQIIIRFWGEPDQIHENYDFVHCTCYWKSWDGELVLPSAALEAILSKTLVYMGSKYPICSVIRTRKFLRREWKITAGQYLKMCMQISRLDLTDIRVLEDQLTGVDAAYFMQLIYQLEKHMKDTGTDQVDACYLTQLIDKIF